MAFEIPIVIDRETFDKLIENTNASKFLFFWLQERSTKAVIIKSKWAEFYKRWDQRLEAGEAKDVFFRFIRGIVRPYRKEGHNDEVEDPDPVEETVKIVNRDYDIVEYLIVQNPEVYKSKDIKISKENILTLKDFYTKMEVENSEIFKEFKRAISS